VRPPRLTAVTQNPSGAETSVPTSTIAAPIATLRRASIQAHEASRMPATCIDFLTF
jgi:hypothetical protein